MNYYNEHDPKAAAWLRELISAGHIPPGHVDERDIQQVTPDDLTGFIQCHFFAGIGGWPLALHLAGWPASRPVWTGSCPCQPFSDAGRKEGFDDPRHLWPEWFRLLRKCAPPVVFGEQVARAIGMGWLDAVADDLEAEGYAIGTAVIPACAVGAPHIRDRLWFVAHADGIGVQPKPEPRTRGKGAALIDRNGQAQPLAHTHGDEWLRGCGLLQVGRERSESEAEEASEAWGIAWPAEPDLPRVAHGVSNRLAKLRGLGNAIVPQVAAQFIGAYLEATGSV